MEKTDVNRVITQASLLAIFVVFQALPANSQANSFSSIVTTAPTTPPPVYVPPPTPTPTPPPPTVTVPTPPPQMPIIPVVRTQPVMPLNPMDVTAQPTFTGGHNENVSAMNGIATISDAEWPNSDTFKGSSDFILARGDANSDFCKETPYSVNVKKGTVLVSVRRPTRLAFITTVFGDIAMTGDADVLVRLEKDSMHLINLDGRAQTVKVKLSAQRFDEQNATVIALAPGFELIAASRALKPADVRPADGYARRSFKTFANGHLAVCEISTESVLTSSAIVADVAKRDNSQERRVLSDMSKMAAVLNYLNGNQGYKVEPNSEKMATR